MDVASGGSMRWHSLLQAAVVLAVVTLAQPAHAAPPAAPPAEEPLADAAPDGCLKTWLCYSPPAYETAHPAYQNARFKLYLLDVLLGPSFAQWVLPDADKAPLSDADLKDAFKADWLLLVASVAALVPAFLCIFSIVCLPIGYVAVLALSIFQTVNLLWMRPMTHMHIINRALKRTHAVAPKPNQDPAPPPAAPDGIPFPG